MSSDARSGLSVHLTSRDVQKSVAFYRDALGFEVKECWPSPEAPLWANLVRDDQSIMVGFAMEPEKVGEMCAGDAEAEAYWRRESARFRDEATGVGMQVYFRVPDVDALAEHLAQHGVEVVAAPKTQFYGIRELRLDDPDGYRLVPYTPVSMSSCQSCGMPLADAQPGQMYCAHCTDETGRLRPYEAVLEGTVTGYFMGVQKMDRPSAEQAAKEHLAKMPAWGMH